MSQTLPVCVYVALRFCHIFLIKFRVEVHKDRQIDGRGARAASYHISKSTWIDGPGILRLTVRMARGNPSA